MMDGQKEKGMDIQTKSIMKLFQSWGQNKDKKSILSKNFILLNSQNNRVI